MAQTIGMAGWNYGNGRVAAFTRAINKECFRRKKQRLFIRLFVNSCLWACRNNTSTKQIKIFKTEDEDFDDAIKELLEMQTFQAQ